MSENSKVLRVVLNTKGRKTGKIHSVKLRGVLYNEKIYVSRHKPDGDWFQNCLINSEVQIQMEGKTITGHASMVSDPLLERKISELKYPGEERANEKRVAIQISIVKK